MLHLVGILMVEKCLYIYIYDEREYNDILKLYHTQGKK